MTQFERIVWRSRAKSVTNTLGVAAHAIVSRCEEDGHASNAHLLQLIREALVGGVVVGASVLAIGDAVHQGRLDLAVDQLSVTQKFVFDTIGAGDLVVRRVDEHTCGKAEQRNS